VKHLARLEREERDFVETESGQLAQMLSENKLLMVLLPVLTIWPSGICSSWRREINLRKKHAIIVQEKISY